MRIKLPFFLLLYLLTYSTISWAQENKQPLRLAYFKENVKAPLTTKERKMIDEVYTTEAKSLVYNIPQRLKDIKNILRNRVILKKYPPSSNMKYTALLSEVTLFNTYNKSLIRDKFFNPETFNPLKYNFLFYTRGSYVYKVDNTNYYIIIDSQY